jgi:hypothetical protein
MVLLNTFQSAQLHLAYIKFDNNFTGFNVLSHLTPTLSPVAGNCKISYHSEVATLSKYQYLDKYKKYKT